VIDCDVLGVRPAAKKVLIISYFLSKQSELLCNYRNLTNQKPHQRTLNALELVMEKMYSRSYFVSNFFLAI